MFSLRGLLGRGGGDEKASNAPVAGDVSLQVSHASEHDVDDDSRRARVVQRQFLPTIPALARWEIAYAYHPCDAVGGDLLDILEMEDGRVLCVVGDVSGHGTQGALIATTLRKSLRSLLDRVESLADLIVNLNEDMRQDCIPGQFFTAFFALIEPTTGRLVYSCAGHHSALLIDPSGPVHLRRLMASGMAIGVARSADLAQRLTMRETTLPVGSSLVVYTDGVNEARNAAEEEFSEERVMGSLLVSSRGSMQQQVDALFDEAVAFANGEQDDDITVLGIRRLEG
ncbi:MAG: serine/threonine-protein phosphatase [Planctomycetota bacterium]|nr:MAG: serine/threonine-protein phosphatase [Planctomycetota bacterium]